MISSTSGIQNLTRWTPNNAYHVLTTITNFPKFPIKIKKIKVSYNPPKKNFCLTYYNMENSGSPLIGPL